MTDHGTGLMESLDEFIHHRHHGEPAAAASSPVITATREVYTMSKLSDVKTIVEDGAAKLAELAGNPLIDTIAEQGLGLFLTPGEITVITGMIRAFEQAKANGVPEAAPQPPVAAPATTDPRQFGQ